MALGGSANTWNESTPADADLVGLGAGAIRSILTNLRGPLDSEHVFPTVGGSVSGIHRKGSAVAFVGTASQVSSTDTDGRLMLTSNTSRFYHVGSTLTQFIGGRFAVEAAPLNQTVASKLSQIWAIECGVASMATTSTTTTVTLQNTYVTPGAVVVVTRAPSGDNANFVSVQPGVVTTTFQLNAHAYEGTATEPTSAYSVNWIAMGFKAG